MTTAGVCGAIFAPLPPAAQSPIADSLKSPASEIVTVFLFSRGCRGLSDQVYRDDGQNVGSGGASRRPIKVPRKRRRAASLSIN